MIVEARDVWKRYGGRVVLRGVSLRIEEPGIYGLLGPNGAGKTTFMNILVGVASPDSGEVLVNGRPPKDPSVRARIGFSPQDPGLIDQLTGFENALFYAELYGVDPGTARERLIGIGERLGLPRSVLARRVGGYSGGMKKKLGVIISLLHDPEILVLDEPTSGMDPGARRELWSLLEELRGRGKMIILATHYMDEAERLCDRVALINDGAIVAEGSPGELKRKHGPRAVVEVAIRGGVDEAVESILRGEAERIEVLGDKALLHVEDPDRAVPRIIDRLYGAGRSVTLLHVRYPSLDDVFLRLTGRRIEGP